MKALMNHKSAPLIFLICASILLTAQMPGWKYYRDREGNSWFIDGNGKFYFNSDLSFVSKPVSSRNLDYSLGQADEFLRDHKKPEALFIWKSILCLEPVNSRISEARKRASAMIAEFRKREGDRFSGLDREASPVIFSEKGNTIFVSDFMRYQISVKGGAELLKKRFRFLTDYAHQGMTAGVLPETGSKSGGPYSYLIAVDAERFRSRINGMEEAMTHWGVLTGYDGLQRKIIKENDSLVLYEFTSKKNEYSGFEAVTVNDDILCVFRLIAPGTSFSEVRERMLAAVESIKIVKR